MRHPSRRSDTKVSPVAIVVDHFETFRNYDSGKRSMYDFAVYLGVPSLAVVAAWWFGAHAQNLPQVLTAVSVLTGLTFSLFTLVFTLAARAADADEHGLRVLLLDLSNQVRANVSYAVLIGIVLTALLGGLVMFTDTRLPAGTATTWVIIFLGSQMLLTIFMVIRRVRSLHDGLRLNKPDPIP